jgi:hypothetical protein
MSNVAQLDAARVSENFLSTVFNGKPDNATILMWTLEKKRSHWFNKVPPQVEINKLATGDTFFGLGLAAKDMVDGMTTAQRAKVRCKRENIIGIPGLWLDIDYKNDAHKKAEWLPECDTAWELTMETLNSIGITPSISVGSGNGFLFYILFEEIWMFKDANEHLLATTMAQKLSEYMKMSFNAHNYQVDSVFDLARVLRLPGTMNWKGEVPVPATIIDKGTSYKRYPRESISDALASFVVPEAARKARDTSCATKVGTTRSYGITLSPTAEVPLDKHESLCANDPSFLAVWERKKTLKDSSPSGYDMSLACYAAIAHWNDQEIVDLLVHHRRKHGSDLKIERFDYYQATVAKARRIVGHSVAMNELETVHERAAAKEKCEVGAEEVGQSPVIPSDRVVTPEMRKEILALLSEIFGFALTSMQKYNTAPPEYYMETSAGNVHIGEVNFLLSQTQFAHKVAAACGVAIRNFPAPQWQTIKQRLLDACESIDVGDEAREDGLLSKYIHEFLRICKPTDLKDKATTSEMPFFEKGRVYLFASKLRTWVRMQYMTDITPKRLGMTLKQLGGYPVVVNTSINGKRSTKAAWRLPETFGVHIPEVE